MIAIICGLAFGTTYRETEQDLNSRYDSQDDKDNSNSIVAGFLLALLTLPLSDTMISCCKAKLMLENDVKNGGKKAHNEEEGESDIKR